MRPQAPFRFKQFSVDHHQCAHKVGTDGVLLGAWAQAENPKHILDVGTGSGLIALMLAQRFASSQIIGIEIDSPSTQQAKKNVANSPFAQQIKILQGNFLETAFAECFDLIVSNPPFYKGNTSSGSQPRDRARHEEFLPITQFLNKVLSLLNPQGQLALILPPTEALEWQQVAETQGLHLIRKTRVKGSPTATEKRWLLQLSLQQQTIIEDHLTLRNNKGGRSQAYANLMQDFYI